MMLSDVCLSVAYIGPKLRTERPRKTKIGTEVAHVTRDSDTTFKAKRSKVNLQGRGIFWRHPAQPRGYITHPNDTTQRRLSAPLRKHRRCLAQIHMLRIHRLAARGGKCRNASPRSFSQHAGTASVRNARE